MQTSRWRGVGPTAGAEIDYRIERLRDEAEAERLAGPRDGVRQHVGHAVMEIGRAIHGIEVEHPVRPSLQPR